MKSATHKVFGLSALNSRFTLSSGRGAALSLKVVFTVFPRTAPAKPIRFIRRSTVQRATVMLSRLSCRQTFRTP